MNKIWLIIKREFITRVRKRSFLIVTLLVPLFFAAMIVVPILIATNSKEEKRIAVIDDSHLFMNRFPDDKGVYYKYLENTSVDSFQHKYAEYGYSGLLYIPQLDIERPSGVTYYSDAQPGLSVESKLTRRINDLIEEERLKKANIDAAQLKAAKADISIEFRTGNEGQKGSAAVAYGVGYASGFIIYIILMFFGMSVMRGVMEEKVSRIAEVMISSVKPFQLMMGKIIGIAAVGLLQFLIWVALIVSVQLILPLFISGDAVAAMNEGNTMMQGGSNAAMVEAIEKIQFVVGSVNWTAVISCFVFYFLGGYLFYSALFAAVGSLVNEDPTDAQALTFPITLPIIIGIMVMISSVQNPSGPVAFWGSIIPFTSPMVMMARIPYGVPGTVPYWQLALSMSLLIVGFLFTTWMAGKIYRTGILMYGKKITWKEALKWVSRKA
ncbi:ABC-2 type transport system permease protein [Chitinophaga sp. YR627]|uniref:ABC transporter permease n=1 Tax=Chitinophaga sp. YR627 TaxID=1881041 RepID=UPI0008E798EF|nr:ABC transporter permease [Chitinophaga sp. YR627]SFO25429.1 ABC-2 type transport system permease protein [Chitinophaga sp. YR627]